MDSFKSFAEQGLPGWLSFLPVSALEDKLRNINLETEEAQEVDEEDAKTGFHFR